LEEFLGTCEFQMEAPTLGEIRMALKGTAGREFFVSS